MANTMGLPLPLHPLILSPLLVLVMSAGGCAGFDQVYKTIDIEGMRRFRGASQAMSLINFQNFTYQQTLDHFNYRVEGYHTFPQRYSIDFSHWGGPGTGSPILVYTGAELTREEELPNYGFHVAAAPTLRAMVVYIEHRYYGSSVPFGSAAAAYRDADTLGYMSLSQALADYAEIIIDIQKGYDAKGPVIAIGCSYGGMVSAYMRLKYPHVVHGSLSASGPVLYPNGDVSNRRGFYDVVSRAFRDTSPTCFDTIRASWAAIDRVNLRRQGIQQLIRIFNPCVPFASARRLKRWLKDQYVTSAQQLHPSGWPIRGFCAGVDANASATTLEKIRAGLDNINGGRCHDIQGPPGSQPPPSIDGWVWQTCTEIILPFGSQGGLQSMFEPAPFDLNTYLRTYCIPRNYIVAPRPQWMATAYNITNALESFGSNIIFSNGLRDPWSDGGVLQDISPSLVALVTNEGSHCTDLYPATPNDPFWLRDQRRQEIAIIQGWITNYHFSFTQRDDH